MNDENNESETGSDAENPLVWLFTVALKTGVARLTELILDALDL